MKHRGAQAVPPGALGRGLEVEGLYAEDVETGQRATALSFQDLFDALQWAPQAVAAATYAGQQEEVGAESVRIECCGGVREALWR